MNKLFINEEGRVRSGLRAAFFLIVYVLLTAGMIFASLGLLAWLPLSDAWSPYLAMVVPYAISAAIALLLGWLFGRKLDGVPFVALGASPIGEWLRNLLLGCAVGGAALLLAIVIPLTAGAMTFSINRASALSAIVGTLAATLAVFAIGAASEEALFRGYLLQTFVRERAGWIGIVFTSVLFAVAHNNNPSANWFSWANTLLAGIWFAAAYLKTRDLWFPFGIHLAWNWLQGPVFGISVSGLAEFTADPITRASDHGPAWLTGGNYGIEGGIACTVALLLSIANIYFLPNLTPETPIEAKT